MKISICIPAVLLLLASFPANSQSILGFSGGYNYTSYHAKDESPHFSGTFDSDPSYIFTAYFKGREKKHTHIGFEASYVNKKLDMNASYGGLGSQTTRDVKYNLDYLYFSIYPEWTFGNKLIFNISTGPSFGFLVHSTKEGHSSYWSMEGTTDSWSDSGSADDDFFGGDMRIFARLGLEYRFYKNFSLSLDNAYSIGIINIANGGLGSYAEFLNSYDINVSIGLIYRLDKLKLSAILPNTQKIEREKKRELNKEDL